MIRRKSWRIRHYSCEASVAVESLGGVMQQTVRGSIIMMVYLDGPLEKVRRRHPTSPLHAALSAVLGRAGRVQAERSLVEH